MTTACRLWARACAATCWSSLPPSPSPSPSSSRPSPPPPCAASSFSGVARFMTSRMWHELDWDERHAAHNLGSEQADWDVGNMHESVAKLRWAELTDMQLGTHSSSDTRKPPGTKRERERRPTRPEPSDGRASSPLCHIIQWRFATCGCWGWGGLYGNRYWAILIFSACVARKRRGPDLRSLY